MLLYKTTTDQNVDTTRRNPIHFISGFAVRAVLGCSILLKISQNQGFLYEKNRAAHLFSTLKIYT